jgi:hypothetical protein
MSMNQKPTKNGIDWEAKSPGYNQENCMPRPYREITHAEFMDLMFCGNYSMEGTYYRSVYDIVDKYASVHFYHYPLYTLAVAVRYDSPKILKELEQAGYMPLAKTGEYGYALKFYKVGCDHKWSQDQGRGMFDHRFTCLLCGQTHGYDSSG